MAAIVSKLPFDSRMVLGERQGQTDKKTGLGLGLGSLAGESLEWPSEENEKKNAGQIFRGFVFPQIDCAPLRCEFLHRYALY